MDESFNLLLLSRDECAEIGDFGIDAELGWGDPASFVHLLLQSSQELIGEVLTHGWGKAIDWVDPMRALGFGELAGFFVEWFHVWSGFEVFAFKIAGQGRAFFSDDAETCSTVDAKGIIWIYEHWDWIGLAE